MTSNRHRSRLYLMMKLPIASSRTRQFPAIIFNFLNHVSYFQRRAFLKLLQIASSFAATFAALALAARTVQSLASRSARLPVSHSRSALAAELQSAMLLHPAAESQPAQMQPALPLHLASALGSLLAACSLRSCPSTFRLAQTQSEFRCFRYRSPHPSEPILHTPTLNPQTYRLA
jgi:hypothetical protein